MDAPELMMASWSATRFAREHIPDADITLTRGEPEGVVVTHGLTMHAAAIDISRLIGADQPASLSELSERLTQPVLTGAVLERCARWGLPRPAAGDENDHEAAVAELLWDPRADAHHLTRFAHERLFLRANAIRKASVDTNAAAGVVSQIYARAQLGMFSAHVVEAALESLDNPEVADPELVAALVEICDEVAQLGDGNGAGLLALARRWIDLTDPAGEGGDSAVPGRVPASENGDRAATPAEQPAQPENTPPQPGIAPFLTALNSDIADEAALLAAAIPHHNNPGQVEAAELEAATERGYGIAASKVFLENRRPEHRAPTDDDLLYRTELIQRLQRIQLSAPHRTLVPAIAPGIRLNTTKLVQQRAQRIYQIPVTATPWKTVRHLASPKPPLHCALVVDVSGSNHHWVAPAGRVAWALAAAARRLGGRCAATTFGGIVKPFLFPNAETAQIPTARTTNSSSGCVEAINAAVGAARLTQAGGARLLIVLTDGLLPEHASDVSAAIDHLVGRGVAVIWALTDDRAHVIAPDQAQVIENVSPVDFPELVCEATAAALDAAVKARTTRS